MYSCAQPQWYAKPARHRFESSSGSTAQASLKSVRASACSTTCCISSPDTAASILTVEATGDLHVDAHHTAEDVAISVGRALNDALGDRAGIARFADRTVPLDESLIQVALDLSGRPYAAIGLDFPAPMIGELPTSMAKHILQTIAFEGRLALHVRQLAGENEHHILEATFKALARCLRDAVRVVDEASAPSTKGTLDA